MERNINKGPPNFSIDRNPGVGREEEARLSKPGSGIGLGFILGYCWQIPRYKKKAFILLEGGGRGGCDTAGWMGPCLMYMKMPVLNGVIFGVLDS